VLIAERLAAVATARRGGSRVTSVAGTLPRERRQLRGRIVDLEIAI
jgi:hypothetical protein